MKMLQIINKRIDELNENYKEVYEVYINCKDEKMDKMYRRELEDIQMLIDELLDLKQEYLQEVAKDETSN